MNTLAFDIETVPDVALGRKLFGLEDVSDSDVAKAMVFRQLQRQGSDFLPHPVSRGAHAGAHRQVGTSSAHADDVSVQLALELTALGRQRARLVGLLGPDRRRPRGHQRHREQQHARRGRAGGK